MSRLLSRQGPSVGHSPRSEEGLEQEVMFKPAPDLVSSSCEQIDLSTS